MTPSFNFFCNLYAYAFLKINLDYINHLLNSIYTTIKLFQTKSRSATGNYSLQTKHITHYACLIKIVSEKHSSNAALKNAS